MYASGGGSSGGGSLGAGASSSTYSPSSSPGVHPLRQLSMNSAASSEKVERPGGMDAGHGTNDGRTPASASAVSILETNPPTSAHLFTMGDFAAAAIKVAQAQGVSLSGAFRTVYFLLQSS